MAAGRGKLSRMVKQRMLGLILAVSLCPAWTVAAQDAAPETRPDTSPAETQSEIPYDVEIGGAEGDLADKIGGVSRLIELKDRPPPSMIALQRRADDDRNRIGDLLRAEGYYDGAVDIAIDEAATPVKVRVAVTPGPVYTLKDVTIAYEGPPPATPLTLADLGLEPGRPARAQPILDAESKVTQVLARHAHPLARLVERRAVVDHEARTMTVELRVDAGPPAAFGPVTVTGARNVDPDWVRRRVPWAPGEPYDQRQLEKLRKSLVDSQLFAAIRITPATQLGPDGQLPVAIAVEERPERSIGFGIGYSTPEGFNGQAYWEHRNLFGEAERLRIQALTSSVRSSLEGRFRKPDIIGVNRDLLANASIVEERTDAYNTLTAGASLGIEWRLSDIWTVTGSAAVERTVEEENDRTRRFTLVSLPLTARRDSTNDLLNPTEGSRFIGEFRPYLGALGSDLTFTSTVITESAYWALDDDKDYVLAGWVQAGTILGANARDVPADKRFYAGGGGSVRGYGYQKAGPVDQAGDPIGGRSLLAFGTELRMRVYEDFGIVPFIEAGNVYPDALPTGGRFHWGAGLGFRYYTPIGPVRLDFAVPLNPRSGIDDPFQIYLSLGQAF